MTRSTFFLAAAVRGLAALGVLFCAKTSIAQDATNHAIVVEADELRSAYGAPPDLSRARISTLTKSYVLPPFSFELETVYNGNIARHGPPQHLFNQEIEMGLPARFDLALENQLSEFQGRGGERGFGSEVRYALADWNKLPFNPTISAGYRFGVSSDHRERDAADLGLIFSHDFGHEVEWALNFFAEEEVNHGHAPEWGFAQSVEIPVLPEERLEVGAEMQYRHAETAGTPPDRARGFVIGPTLAWKPSGDVRVDVSPLFGCTDHAPRLQMFVVVSWSLGKSEATETDAPASARTR